MGGLKTHVSSLLHCAFSQRHQQAVELNLTLLQILYCIVIAVSVLVQRPVVAGSVAYLEHFVPEAYLFLSPPNSHNSRFRKGNLFGPAWHGGLERGTGSGPPPRESF